MDKREHRGSIIGPVILIGVGLVFLLNNLGLLSWSVWDTILSLWPVLLIAAGLDILIGRRSCLGSLLVLILVLALIAGGVWLALSPAVGGQELPSETIGQPLPAARLADVTINPGLGRLRLSALTETGKLAAGTVSLERGEQTTSDLRISGDTAYYTLKSQGWRSFGGWFGANRTWDLQLTGELPLRLKTSNGMGESDLDLARLNLASLDVSTGMGKTTVTLPGRGQFQAKVSAGMGEVIVNIPAGMAARIHARTGLGVSRVFGQQGFGNVSMTTPGYETAESRVELEVSCGMGSVVIQKY